MASSYQHCFSIFYFSRASIAPSRHYSESNLRVQDAMSHGNMRFIPSTFIIANNPNDCAKPSYNCSVNLINIVIHLTH